MVFIIHNLSYFMKKIFKKKWFWGLIALLIIIIGAVVFSLLNKKPTVQYTTEDVKKGSLTQTVSATGSVEPSEDISLNFKSPGKLVFLDAKEGQIVKAGQVLARIDSASLSAQVKQAQANVSSAVANYQKVKAGAGSEDIQVYEEQVNKAQNDLNNLITQKQDKLATMQSDYNEQVSNLRDSNINYLNSSISVAQVALNKINDKLVDTSKNQNMQVSNIGLKNRVDNNYNITIDSFLEIKKQVGSINSGTTNGDLMKVADNAKNFLNTLLTLLNDSYDLANSIIENSNYPQATISSIKSDISGQQTAVNTSISSLQTARANLNSAIATYPGSVINTTNTYDSQIKAASDALSIAQAQLALKKAGPRSFDLASAEANVAQAQAQLDALFANLNDYSIKAPIDGRVNKVNFNLGEQTSMSQSVIQMQSDLKYQIKVDIPESDVTKIKIGDKAVINLDAFGNDHLFSGSVTFIDPAQTVIQDVTYYKTTVIFNEDSFIEQVKPGMTADVTLVTNEKQDVLYIAQRAVRLKDTALGENPVKYVQVLENGQAVEKIVTTGLRADNGLVEITSGLSEGEKVVTFTKGAATP